MNSELLDDVELTTRTKDLLNSPVGEMPLIQYLPPAQPVKVWLYLTKSRLFTWRDLFRDLVDHFDVTDVNHPARAFRSLRETEILFRYCNALKPTTYEHLVFAKICWFSALIDNQYLKSIANGDTACVDVPDTKQQTLIRKILRLRKKQLRLLRKRLVSQYYKTGLVLIASDYKRQAAYNIEVDLKVTIGMDCEQAVQGYTNLWLEGGALNDWLTITESKASAEWLADRIYSYVKGSY